MGKKKHSPEFEITELFLVQAGKDYSRTCIAQIYRETTKDGKSIVRGSVEVTDGKLWSIAETDTELGKFLDTLCLMKLDMELHSHVVERIDILGFDYHMN